MKNTVFISLLVLVLFSCKKNVPEPSVYDFELVKTSKIILNPEDRNRSNIQFAETDNGNILVISCGNKLVFY
ncbi:MAG: hypothetical protein LBQ22_02700, partial [Bacteroidales bacterium]|nr:hypothetical protein [Bacteroidales bacterium]